MNPKFKLLAITVVLFCQLSTVAQDKFKLVIDYQFEDAKRFQDYGMAIAKKNGKWGYIDNAANVVIDFQFDEAFDFNKHDLACVKKYGKWGFIDKKGNVIFDFQFDETFAFTNDGIAIASKNGKYGYIDKTGSVVVDFQFDWTNGFAKNGLAAVQKNGNYGYINKAGNVVIDYVFHGAGRFADNGLAGVFKVNKYGFINSKGVFVIQPQYIRVEGFASVGLASVESNEGWCYVDAIGKELKIPNADWVDSFSKNGLAKISVTRNNKSMYGLINKYGEIVVECQFESIDDFYDGMARVMKNGKYGLINQKGEVLINYEYDMVSEFGFSGFALVVKNDKWSFIDKKGRLLTDFKFDGARSFNDDGFAAVKKGDKWGFIDRNGDIVIDCQFDGVSYYTDIKLISVKKNDRWGYVVINNPTADVETYIRNEISKWQQKGKYETTDAYKARVNETTRKKKLEELSVAAVQQIAPKYCNWSTITTEYDADNQTFKVTVNGLSPFYVKIPISDAEAFDLAISKLKFSNLQYALGSDNKFFLKKAVIVNPLNAKKYNFSSTDKAVFAYSQLNMNFEPIQINVQTTDKAQTVKTETKSISVGLADVDVNIPVNPQTNDKTFVVIIANENYSREVKVQYAANDGKIFKEYCEKTLGIPAKNIHIAIDATFGTMKSEIKWISDVAQAYNGQAKIIFYYAGHGMPNESDKSAYLLPVDGFSTDYETAIKLDDLYGRLTQSPTQGITVFLDACFSGSVRDNGMLANARGVKIRPKADLLKGKMVVLSAASGDETAYPYKEKQHGLFTYFLLKKLQETKGNVDFQNLSNYVIDNVKQQSVVVNQKSQTPQVRPSSEIMESWRFIKIK